MTAAFGAFGKIPTVGDFFRLSPPAGFVRIWDPWIQTVMATGQSTYGPHFDRHYMSAPIWRFTLPAGVAGAQKVTGVVMPSIDRVGRRFPLTLVAALPTPGPVALDHFSDSDMFEALEDIALDCLEDSMDQTRLAQQLASVRVPDMRAVAPLRSSDDSIVLTGVGEVSRLPVAVAAGLLEQQGRDLGIWSTVLEGQPRMLACKGLPTGPQAMGLFDLGAGIWREARPI
ncbi:type VI secretion system-associated protein TagF [Phaeobacter sp. HF9A]|uniref:type VI secretion system-associated protein TagF n=1 Tax=Phaeobacter sp. HF9A TaxID=2721561 RepID=UPI00142FA1F0|nr:type VI secretion system-associated protein TagF [Phaeobacter sp. HF9A]NIZ15312.1 type VI secretion system-associated protein TagF [Phaeobacter sp. HF9A]